MIFKIANGKEGPELEDTIQHATHKARKISAENVPQWFTSAANLTSITDYLGCAR
jgi:hypothetical protein